MKKGEITMKKETTTVYTQKDLGDALKARYQVINVEGDLSQTVIKEMNKNKGLIKGLSGVSIVVGLFFWPLLIAGLAGAVISKDDFKYYKAEVKGDTIILRHK